MCVLLKFAAMLFAQMSPEVSNIEAQAHLCSYPDEIVWQPS